MLPLHIYRVLIGFTWIRCVVDRKPVTEAEAPQARTQYIDSSLCGTPRLPSDEDIGWDTVHHRSLANVRLTIDSRLEEEHVYQPILFAQFRGSGQRLYFLPPNNQALLIFCKYSVVYRMYCRMAPSSIRRPVAFPSGPTSFQA